MVALVTARDTEPRISRCPMPHGVRDRRRHRPVAAITKAATIRPPTINGSGPMPPTVRVLVADCLTSGLSGMLISEADELDPGSAG